MNMAATLFRMTVDECLAGVTREAARALGRLDEIGTLEAGKSCDLAIWNVERLAELPYRMGFNPLHARGLEGHVTPDRSLTPPGTRDARRLARRLSRRRRRARPGHAAAHRGEPPRPSRRIVAKGEPVYGINTGFGKLASVRIEPADLAQLQRNIVLSHAAASASRCRAPIVRLMMALKLASLAQGASGVRPRDHRRCWRRCCEHDLMPVVPAQGSVGASGDLAPLAHMAAAMIGVGEVVHRRTSGMPAAEALARAGLAAARLGPKEGLALLNGTQFSTALCAGRRCSRPSSLFAAGAGHRRAVHRCRQGLRRAVRSAHPRAAPATAARSTAPRRCAR